MADDVPPVIAPSTGDAATRSLVEDVKCLVEDGRTLVEAELAYQKSRVAVAGAGAKGIAGWTVLALALVFFTLMALVVGLLLALAPALGSWGALAAVVLGLLAFTALSAWTAMRRWKRVARLLAEKDQAT